MRRVSMGVALLLCCSPHPVSTDALDAPSAIDGSVVPETEATSRDTSGGCTDATDGTSHVTTETNCANGLDDDCDGLIDCVDPDCLGQSCIAGAPSCCDGVCADLATDDSHCGACGVSCAQGQQCASGVCCVANVVCDTCTESQCCSVPITDASVCAQCAGCDACGAMDGGCTACGACAYVAMPCQQRSYPCNCRAVCSDA